MSDDRDRTKTLNGKFDARCIVCGLCPYTLWVDSVPPPVGCSEGYDQSPWLCAFVYNNFVAITMKHDGYLSDPISDVGRALMQRLGPKAEELMNHIRSRASPDAWRKKHGIASNRRPPEYTTPQEH